MEHVSNEEKAKEFATTHDGKIIGFAHIAALQMAQWKDKQFEEMLNNLPESVKDLIKTLAL